MGDIENKKTDFVTQQKQKNDSRTGIKMHTGPLTQLIAEGIVGQALTW